jgi:rod shape-determining protein MreD
MRNLIAFPLLGFAVILQSAVISRMTLLAGHADLILLMLAAWALQVREWFGWQWAFVASILIGFVSHLSWPVTVLSYFSLVLIAQALRRRVWEAPLLAMFSVTFIGTLILHLLTYLVLRIEGISISLSDAIEAVTLPTLLLNLLFAIPVYAMMRDLAQWVDPPEEIV